MSLAHFVIGFSSFATECITDINQIMQLCHTYFLKNKYFMSDEHLPSKLLFNGWHITWNPNMFLGSAALYNNKYNTLVRRLWHDMWQRSYHLFNKLGCEKNEMKKTLPQNKWVFTFINNNWNLKCNGKKIRQVNVRHIYLLRYRKLNCVIVLISSTGREHIN